MTDIENLQTGIGARHKSIAPVHRDFFRLSHRSDPSLQDGVRRIAHVKNVQRAMPAGVKIRVRDVCEFALHRHTLRHTPWICRPASLQFNPDIVRRRRLGGGIRKERKDKPERESFES
jgi:hypothetical protein